MSLNSRPVPTPPLYEWPFHRGLVVPQHWYDGSSTLAWGLFGWQVVGVGSYTILEYWRN